MYCPVVSLSVAAHAEILPPNSGHVHYRER